VCGVNCEAALAWAKKAKKGEKKGQEPIYIFFVAPIFSPYGSRYGLVARKDTS
jgi:hypothetical protein